MVVLATKCYVSGDARDRALTGMGALVDNAVGDLRVDWEVGVREDAFVAVTVEGEDATAARNALAERWGRVPPDPDRLDAGEAYVGTLESWDDDGFTLDVGGPVRLPADRLGLGRGTPRQAVERFGLVQHQPLAFEAGDPHALADRERDRLFDWRRGPGRVNVNSATRGGVRATVNRAGHATDIVTVERLGLLEQSIVCREGTDPPGLLAAIGPHLPAEMRCVLPE